MKRHELFVYVCYLLGPLTKIHLNTMGGNPKDDWSIPCFAADEDLEPSAEELESMYQQIESGKILKLQWKCPERRQPSPITSNETEVADAPEKEVPTKNKDFDFMDEAVAPMRVRLGHAAPKGSAKKKTANFAGVIDAMKKHGRLTQPASAPTSSKDA